LTFVAEDHNQWPNVKMLIEHGADVNATQFGGDDYITMAYRYSGFGDFEQTYWLLQHGADPTKVMDNDPKEPNYGRMPVVESIYYAILKPTASLEWQRKCQHWLRDHGIARPTNMGNWKPYRQGLGKPSDPKDIPLL
jgi:hypothetical protein